MKRFFTAMILAFMMFPAAAGALSLATLVEPAAEASEPAPGNTAEPAGPGRLGGVLDRSDEPVESSTGWFVGPLIWKVYLDFSALEPMTLDRDVPALDDNPYIIGVMGGLIRDNWRFGGLYVTGAQSGYNKVAGEWRGARITLDAFGVFVDYDREYKSAMAKKYYSRVPYLRYGYLIGGILAYGQLGIEASGPDLGPSNKWSNDQGILIVNPYVGVWASPFDWVWGQVELGYILLLMSDEQITNDEDNVMVDGAIGGGPHLGFKLVFGSNPNFKVKVAEPR